MKGELSGGTILIFMNFMPFMVEKFDPSPRRTGAGSAGTQDRTMKDMKSMKGICWMVSSSSS